MRWVLGVASNGDTILDTTTGAHAGVFQTRARAAPSVRDWSVHECTVTDVAGSEIGIRSLTRIAVEDDERLAVIAVCAKLKIRGVDRRIRRDGLIAVFAVVVCHG